MTTQFQLIDIIIIIIIIINFESGEVFVILILAKLGIFVVAKTSLSEIYIGIVIMYIYF